MAKADSSGALAENKVRPREAMMAAFLMVMSLVQVDRLVVKRLINAGVGVKTV